MDSAWDETDSLESNGTALPAKITLNGPTSKGGQGLLHKLFSRQASMPRISNKTDVTDTPLDSVGHLLSSKLQVTPCPYIRPLENRLEPRLESAPRGHRRVVAGSIISTSSSRGDHLQGAYSCPAMNDMVDNAQSDVEASHLTELTKMKLQGNIAAAAAADSSHLKDWANYIRCYSEVSLCMPLSEVICLCTN